MFKEQCNLYFNVYILSSYFVFIGKIKSHFIAGESDCYLLLAFTVGTWLIFLFALFLLASADHVFDPVGLCGSGQGWTPPVSLHRL